MARLDCHWPGEGDAALCGEPNPRVFTAMVAAVTCPQCKTKGTTMERSKAKRAPRPVLPWSLVGENAGALVCDAVLPLDWHTVALALLAYAKEVGRHEAKELLGAGLKARLGVKCWAPPGEWFGGEYYSWADQPAGTPDGWVVIGEHGDECHQECERPDVLCVWFLASGVLEDARAKVKEWSVPPNVNVVAAGPGVPWLCRVIGPVTVVDLHGTD